MTRFRVLVIEDNETLLKILVRMLSLHHDVEGLTSSQRAIERIPNEKPFDVIVTDLRMPGIDGEALLKWVHENAPETGRVLITGTDVEMETPDDPHDVWILPKPVEIHVLRNAIETLGERLAALRRGSGP